MKGMHTFQLNCHHLYPSSIAFRLEVQVQYEVEVMWNKLDHSVDMGKATPEYFTLITGETQGNEEDFDQAVGPLKAFILSQSESLGLEQLGITDAEAREDIMEREDDERHVREHAAGRI